MLRTVRLPAPVSSLALALELLSSRVAGASFGKFQLSTGQVRLFGRALQGIFRFLLCRKCRSFIKLLATKRGISKYGHEVRLNFKHATGDVKEMLITVGILDSNFTGL